jgi:hypothetical protein
MKKNGDAFRHPHPVAERAFDVPKTSEEMAEMELVLRSAGVTQTKKPPVRLSKAPDTYMKGWWVYPTMTPGDGQPPTISFNPDQEDAARMCLAMCQHGGTLYELRDDGYWWRYFCD